MLPPYAPRGNPLKTHVLHYHRLSGKGPVAKPASAGETEGRNHDVEEEHVTCSPTGTKHTCILGSSRTPATTSTPRSAPTSGTSARPNLGRRVRVRKAGTDPALPSPGGKHPPGSGNLRSSRAFGQHLRGRRKLMKRYLYF